MLNEPRPDETLGAQIRRYRQLASLLQVDVALQAGVTGTTVSRWETDTELPSTASLMALARVFGCRVVLDGETIRLGPTGELLRHDRQQPGPIGRQGAALGQPNQDQAPGPLGGQLERGQQPAPTARKVRRSRGSLGER